MPDQRRSAFATTALLVSVVLISGLLAACRYVGSTPRPSTSPLAAEQTSTPTPVEPSLAPSPPIGTGALQSCTDVPPITAPAEYYRDDPIYVANEMPTQELRAWAESKPGYEGVWIDRNHLGWVTLAFSVDAAARQEELEHDFPGVGVVAVQVDWTKAELEELQQRAIDELGPGAMTSAGTLVNYGVMALGIGLMTPDRIAAAEAVFAGERVCLEGVDPADAPQPGAQPQAGEGWRLLADEDKSGEPYRTGIAFDVPSYELLWTVAGLSVPRAEVDFYNEVAIWFGAVHGSSCPNLRLDDVVVDGGLLYPSIVLLDAFGACTDDAIGHAYVVALERARLPHGPFAIQLGADDPPLGAPGERTVVEADLSQPGSTAEPEQVYPASPQPETNDVGPGGIIETDFPAVYRQSVECGLEWLGPLNGVYWRTEATAGSSDWLPADWSGAVVDGMIDLDVLMRTGDPPTMTATVDGFAVLYEASPDEPPGC